MPPTRAHRRLAVQLALLAAAAVLSFAALAATAPRADAVAHRTGHCGPAFKVGHKYRWYCELWRGGVPVYNEPWVNGPGSQDGAITVGHLVHGGRANWFEGQVRDGGSFFVLRSYWTKWWAYTQADNGRWGYVPLVYFKGGGNDEPSSMACRFRDPHHQGWSMCP